MATPSIQQAVYQAADQLLAQGIRPTVANVRAITLRGSAGTINDALRDWWRELAERLNARRPAPDVPEPVAAMVAQLWDLAMAEGSRAFQSYREEAEQLVSAAERNRIDAENAQQALQLQLAESRALIERLQEGEKVWVARVAEESALRTDLEKRLGELQEQHVRAMSELDQARLRLDKEVTALAGKYQHAAQQARQAAEALQEQQALHAAREDEFQRQLDESRTQSREAERQTLTARTEVRLLQERLSALQDENAALLRESQRPATRKDTLRARLKRF